jgi:hypothetical protein
MTQIRWLARARGKIDVPLADSVISAGPAGDEDPLAAPLGPGERLQPGSPGEIDACVFRRFDQERARTGSGCGDHQAPGRKSDCRRFHKTQQHLRLNVSGWIAN